MTVFVNTSLRQCETNIIYLFLLLNVRQIRGNKIQIISRRLLHTAAKSMNNEKEKNYDEKDFNFVTRKCFSLKILFFAIKMFCLSRFLPANRDSFLHFNNSCLIFGILLPLIVKLSRAM